RKQRLWRTDATLALDSLRPSSFRGGAGAALDQDYRLHALSCLCHFARQSLPIGTGHFERNPQAALSLLAVWSADSVVQRVKRKNKATDHNIQSNCLPRQVPK